MKKQIIPFQLMIMVFVFIMLSCGSESSIDAQKITKSNKIERDRTNSNQLKLNNNKVQKIIQTEKQLTSSGKTHALDNNDNFSPDGKFLCYDTRNTVYDGNLANSKSIEKLEIATGKEIVLYEPNSITGDEAAPGVAAVSYHPNENKLIFIHGPMPEEVAERGYYNIRNRTAAEINGNGNKTVTKLDMRDISNKATTSGAHRGGTHRHEYSRNGNRIGFTYDDFLLQQYDRTIGFMQRDNKAPKGYTHFFAIILKPIEKGKSKAGEIEKAFGDSWVNANGTIRAFIGKVRAENGVDYYNDLFVAEIPKTVDIHTASSGTQTEFPKPPKGITIRRLTRGMNVEGIVRASLDGEKIAFAAKDKDGIHQVFVQNVNATNEEAIQITQHEKPVGFIRWHQSGRWVFYVMDGDVLVSSINEGGGTSKSIQLTDDDLERSDLVISKDGNTLAYIAPVPTYDANETLLRAASCADFKQVFIMENVNDVLIKE